MKTRKLGANGPEFSTIGYGAWEASGHWGADLDEAKIVEAIAAGVESGINWIDTAEVYGPHTSEEIVGRAVRGLDDVMVATKVAPQPAGSGFAPDEVRKACEGSLARLGRDVIDLYQLHWPDGSIEVEETWATMVALKEEGLVRAIGVSNFDRSLIERCLAVGHVDSIQPHFSLLARDNADLIAWCGERGIGAVGYGPLAYGLLTGTITKDTRFDAEDWRGGFRNFILYQQFFAPEKLEASLAAVDALRPVAARAGVPLGDLAIAWVLHQPGITSAIVGSRNAAHVRANAAAAALGLEPNVLAEIEAALQS